LGKPSDAGPPPRLHHKLELNKGGVSHCGLAIYIKKYFKEKEELWKFKYFTKQKYNLLKETKILQDIITL